VQATGVVEALDIAEPVSPRLVARGVDPVMDTFGFEDAREARHEGVVPAVPLAAHGRGDAGSGLSRAIGLGGILDLEHFAI
jgi:hypothetical protein